MKTQKEMADEYDIHRSTFIRKLKNLGVELPKGLISPKLQEKIYEVLGKPEVQKTKYRLFKY